MAGLQAARRKAMTRVRGAGGRAAEVGAWVDRWVAAAQARTPVARALAAMAALQGARPGAGRAGFCAELRRALQRRWVDLCGCGARTLGTVVFKGLPSCMAHHRVVADTMVNARRASVRLLALVRSAAPGLTGWTPHGIPVSLSAPARLLREGQPAAAARAALDLLERTLPERGDARAAASGCTPAAPGADRPPLGAPDAVACVRALLGAALAALSRAAAQDYVGKAGCEPAPGPGVADWAMGGRGARLRCRAAGLVGRLAAQSPAAFAEARAPQTQMPGSVCGT